MFWVGEEEGVCCWVERGGMTVLCPLVKEGELVSPSLRPSRSYRSSPKRRVKLMIDFYSRTANPLLGFRFMEVFLEVLEEYLGEVRCPSSFSALR